MSTALALIVSAAIIALSAFFVAMEFALGGARRHRLADAVATSASARAALRSAREVSVLLAGSQLGITLCTVALGAITKPAVHDLLLPLVSASGLPTSLVEVASFVLALIVVTFLHLVVGEMAPKAWAIAHPERSATMLAIPMRAFIWATRPVLALLNGMTNRCLRLLGVTPVAEINSGHSPEDLRALLAHSTRTGTLDPRRGAQLGAALDLYSRPVLEHTRPVSEIVTVAPDDTVEAIRRTSRDSGHLRLVVWDNGRPSGVVHVRDALTRPADTTAAELMRPALDLAADTPLHVAVAAMRRGRGHLALVHRDTDLLGLVTLTDLLDQLPLTTNL
jgi:CBS domain containing-hemolysin-like protein